MNRLTPWFDAIDGHRPPTPTDTRSEALAALRTFRIDNGLEPEPTLLDRSPTGEAMSIVLPEPYESRYAYPLIVWLHGRGGDENELFEVLPRISEQNFVGVGLRGPRVDPARPGLLGWDPDDVVDWLPDLHEALVDVRRSYHVHSERIFLAGRGDGARMAMSALLHRPEWFAGALALSGGIPLGPASLPRFNDLRGKRVLLATEPGSGTADHGLMAAVENAATARRLESAGVDVETHSYDAGSEMFRDANRWLVEAALATV